MAKIEKFEDIESWKLAREVTKLVYRVSSTGGFSRDFALRDQIRRSAISIMSNIAEGFERDGDKEFVQFLAIAEFESIYEKLVETSRLIGGLMKYLIQSDLKGSKYR